LSLLETYEKNNEWDLFRDAIRNRCADDLEAFAIIFFPHYCRLSFNSFHTDTFRQYKFGERSIRRVSAAPRGFAKSTLKVLIKPIHDLCYKLEKFVVIISNTDAQAVQKVKDIQTEFITNELLLSVYGEFIPSRKIGSTDFVGHNGQHKLRYLALGSGTEMRGIRFGDVRPTKIILDDVEHSEEVENEMLRDKMLHWYQDVVSKIGDEHTNIEIVGTVLHQKSLLKELLKNPRYEAAEYCAIISWSERKDLWDEWTKIYCQLDNPGRLKDAKEFYESNKMEMDRGVEVLWPEKEPYYYLMEEIIETGIRSFMKEKQNNPMADSEKVFFPEEIWWYKESEHGLIIKKNNVLIPWNQLTCYGAIDPSTGQRKVTSKRKPDFTCIVSGYKDAKGRLFVHHDFTKRVPPSQFISEVFALHDRFNFFNFGVETNLYKNLLTQNILDERKRREKEFKKSIKINFIDIDLVENKEKRIYSLEPKIPHGWILFNEDGMSQEFMNQLYDFPKGNNDDCPDALEMLWGLVNNKYAIGSF
jgi:predicted phage terminase large subunit-like protein